MPTRKWQSSSGASKNRILGATRLKSEGQTIFPVTLNDNSSNGFALNVQGSNLVLGIGTSEPFSRLSMGNNTDSGVFNANDTGRLASLAFNETSSGGKFSGIFYNSNIAKYNQTNDISNNGIQFKTTSLTNFDIYGSGGNLFLTDENITTIGGFPRKGITELDSTDYKGIEKYIKPGNIFGADDPDNKTLTNKEGQSKIVLDVRGSIRTDGYINFFNTKVTTITENGEEEQRVESAPSAAWWSNANRNIPRGSVWLKEAGGGKSEGMYYKNAAGTTLRIEATAVADGEGLEKITKTDALKYDVFNFFFNDSDIAADATNIGEGDAVTYPYVILKGGNSGARVQGGSSSRVGGTALNIRGKNTLLSDIRHQKGFFNGLNEREIFSITEGNMSVTGLSGEEFLIKQYDAVDTDGPNHPISSFATQHGLLSTDALGGKVWIERQLLIGPKKSDLNWGIIDVQTTPNVPTLLSYNLDKGWFPENPTATERLNKRYITEKATNAIILLNKSNNTTGDGDGGGSLVGSLYDCSNSIIIGDTFTSIDTPKSLIITVNPSLTTAEITETNEPGQQVFDDIGGSIVSGKNNWVYKSPYSLIIGKDNFIDNNQPGSYNATGLNSVLGDYNELWTATTNFVAGSYHKVSGGSNFVGGAVNLIGDFAGKIKARNAIESPSSSNGVQDYSCNTVFGYYNKIHNVSGVDYSFAAGNANLVAVSRGVALGTHAYVGGDIRFAIGIDDTITTTTASSGSNSNKFVIDKDGKVGIGTSSPTKKLHIQGGDILIRGNDAAHKLLFQYWDNNSYFGSHSNAVIGAIDFQGNEGSDALGDTGTVQGVGPHLNFRTYASIKAHKGTSSGTFGAGLRFYTHENTEAAYNLQERMCISPDGKVGIGTLDPSSALHIYGEIDQATAAREIGKGIHLGMENDSKDPTINLCSHTYSYSKIRFSTNYDWYPRGLIQYNHSQNTMQFFVNNINEALRLMTNGDIYAPNKVGIGTNSPTAALSVVGGRVDSSHSVGCHLGQASNYAFLELCDSVGGQIDFASGNGSNDANGRINYTHSDNKMSFCTNGTSADVTIDSVGNVGIGTSSPYRHLHIHENSNNPVYLRLSNNESASSGETQVAGFDIALDGDNVSFINREGGWFGFDTPSSGGRRMTILGNGNVGIGTNSPETHLQVEKLNGTASISIRSNSTTQSSRVAVLYFGNSLDSGSNNGLKAGIFSTNDGIGGSNATQQLDFCINNANTWTTDATISDSKMTIRSDGNVGIGTSSPNYILDFGTSTNAIKIPVGTTLQRSVITVTDGLIRYNSTNNEFEGYGNNAWGSLGGVITPTKQTKVTANDANGLQFYTNNTERLTIFQNGNMTFKGTAETQFIIQNSSSSRAKLKLLTVNDDANDLLFAQNNQTKWSFSGRNSGEDYAFKIYSYATGRSPTWQEAIVLGVDCNIGIGLVDPPTDAKLQIHNASDNCEVKITHGNDSKYARLSIMGSGQGTGDLYLGQDANHGGGMIYQGDGTPALISGTGSGDHISFYRRNDGTSYGVFGYMYDSNDVWFRGKIGIGTHFAHNEHPQAEIDVDGSILIRATTSSDTGGSPYYTGGRGIFFRPVYVPGATGHLYNASITAHAHDGSHADGICIAGYDGISFRTGSHSGGGSYGAAQVGERMRIEPTGHVGIGTTNPNNTQLHIKGANRNTSGATSYTDQLLRLEASRSTSFLQWSTSGGGGDDWDLNYSANGSSMSRLWLLYNDSQIFYSNGTPRMVIASGGNVGIGQFTHASLPGHMLHLKGTADTVLRMEADSNNSGENDNPLIWMTQDGIGNDNTYFKIGMEGDANAAFTNSLGNTAYISTEDFFQIATNGTMRMTILQNGNVGIGTPSPTYPLQIKGGSTSAKACQLMIENENYNKGIEFRYKSVSGSASPYYDFPQAKIYTSQDEYGYIQRSSDNTKSYDTCLHFSTATGWTNGNTTAVEVMTLDSVGRVGIGTDSPRAKLHIQRSNTNYTSHSSSSLVIERNDGANWINLLTNNSNEAGILWASSISAAQAGLTYKYGDGMTFRTGNNSIKIKILENGNVGIGTSSPGAKLEVNGQYNDNMLRLRDGSYYANFRISNKFGSPGQLAGNYVNYAQGQSASSSGTTGNAFFIIETYANNEGAAFAMNGETTIIVNPGDYGALQWWDEDSYPSTSGSRWVISTSGGITSSSDIRLKENIDYFDNLFDISKVKQKFSEMKFCTYNLKKGKPIYDGRKTEYWGIIAQEVEVLFPELIETGNDEQKIKMINNERLTMLSHHITKHLIKENSELKTEIETLKTKMSAILERLNAAGI